MRMPVTGDAEPTVLHSLPCAGSLPSLAAFDDDTANSGLGDHLQSLLELR